jgi:hypothetical protein
MKTHKVEQKTKIMEDLSTLQICSSPEFVQSASKKFLEKYKDEHEFCADFKGSWLGVNEGW